MKRSLKLILSALTALIVPAFGWAGQIYTNTLSGDDTSLVINGVTYATTKFTALTNLSDRTATCTGAYGGIIVPATYITTHSVAGWFKVDADRTADIVLWAANNNHADLGGYSVKLTSAGAIQMGRTKANDGSTFEENNSVTTTDSVIAGDTWYHIAMTFSWADGNKLTPLLYINGEPVAFTDTEKTITCGLNGPQSCSHFYIGAGVTAGGLKMNNDAISAENIKNDVYAGSVGYLDSHSVSFYVTSGYGTAYDANTKYGWEGASIIGSNWNPISGTVSNPKSSTGIESTNTTVYVNGKGGAWSVAAPAQLGSANRGYYDGQWDLTLEALPYTNYKVVLFMATDNTGMAWGPVKVTSGGTETYYSYNENKELITVADGSTAYNWGTTATANGSEGVDVMVIPNLSGTVNLLTHGRNNAAGDSTTRGGLFAIQIINTGAIIESREYTAAITEDVTFDEIAWAEEDFENISNHSASVTIADGKTLTFDSVLELCTLKVATANASDTVTIKIDLTEESDVRKVLNKLDLTDTNGVVKVSMTTYTGKATWMAYEFNGNGNNSGSEGTALSWDGNRPLNGQEYTAAVDGNQMLRLPSRPWRHVSSSWPAACTAVMYAKAGSTANGILASFGSSNNNHAITLAVGENPANGDMRLVHTQGKAAGTDLVQNLAVPNSQSSNHLYAFAMYTKDSKTHVDIYVDGSLLTSYTHGSVITLGTGFQIASIHGGIDNTGLNRLADDDAATMDFLRVYDCLLSEEMLQTMAAAYPYTSPSGTATRELDGSAANWVEADDPATAWSQDTLNEDATTTTTPQNAPNDGTNIVLNATAATTVTVNLPAETPAYETLTINGDVTLVAGTDTATLAVSGRTTIDGDVTMPYDLVKLGQVTVKAGNTLTIDASSIDLTKIFVAQTIGLTGLIETEDETAVIEVTMPEAAEGREIELVKTDAGYSLEITFTGILEATVPAEDTTWADLTWTLGETELTSEALPETFEDVPVQLTAEAGATLTLTEDLLVGPLTIAGNDLTLAGEFTFAATDLTTTEAAIAVAEEATLDLTAKTVAGLTQNVKGTGLVKIALTNNHANVVTLTGFEGTTYVTTGYLSVDVGALGTTLRLAGGTQVQTTKTTEDASLNITLEGNVQFHINNGTQYTTTAVITGGTLNKQGAGTLTVPAINSALALNGGTFVVNPGEGESTTLGILSGSSALTIAAGTVTLASGNGGYTGNITIAEGASLATSGDATVPFGKGSIVNNGTLTVGGTNGQLPAVSGTGDVTITAQTRIAGDITTTGTLTIGASVTMTFHTDDFSDADLSINGPSIVLNAAITTTNEGSTITVASGKTISGTGTVNGALALADGATITACSVNVTGDITAAGETVTVVLPEGAKAGDTVIDCANAATLVEKLTVEGFNLVVEDTTIIKLATAAVCKIGDTEYATLAAALEAAEARDTIVLLADAGAIQLPAGVNLDPNGKSVGTVTDQYGNVLEAAGDGTYTYPTYVAEVIIGEETEAYTSFVDAVKAIRDNADVTTATLKMLVGSEMTDTITIAKDVTIDLNGQTIAKKEGATFTGDSFFVVKRGGTLTIDDTSANKDGVIDATGDSAIYAAIKMTEAADGTSGETAALVVKAGTIKGYYYGITGNGLRHDTSITVNGGTIMGTCVGDSFGIYHPQDGVLTINDGAISGATGIEMRAGDLVVSDGTITASATYTAPVANNSGTSIIGAAIAISQHNSAAGREGVAIEIGAEATLSCAEGGKTLVIANTVATADAAPHSMMAALGSLDTVAIEVPTLELNELYSGTGIYALKTVVAAIGGEKYETLQAAYDAATAGQTITLLGNVTGAGLVINKAITIDFNGYTYTVNHAVGSSSTQTLGMQINAATVLKSTPATKGKLTCLPCNLSYDEATVAAVAGCGYTSEKPVRMLINNYANLTVTNVILDGSNLAPNKDNAAHYVLSNNSGAVTISATAEIKANDGDFAFDVCKYRDNEAPTVTVADGAVIDGTVEVTGGTLDNQGDELEVVIASGTVKGEVTVDTDNSDYLVKIGNTYCDEVVDNSGKGEAAAIAAAELFTGIATVDGTTATVDWDFGISDITRDGDKVVITAKVQDTDGDATTAADYAKDTTVTIYADGTSLGDAEVGTDGTATLTGVAVGDISGKKLTVKATK